MRAETIRGVRATVAAGALLVALTGCAGLPFGEAKPDAGVQLPDSVGPAGCGVSSERVSALVDDALAKIGPVQESVLAGEMPDFAALFAPLETDLASLAEGVTDPATLAALESARVALAGFADIPAPQNVLEAAGYVQEFTAQVQALRDAGATLRQLCAAP